VLRISRANWRSGRLLRQPIHFALHQLAIKPLAAHENVGRAVLNDAAGLQHHDAVEIAHRGQPMGDGDHGAPVHQMTERLADRLFGFGIERGGRFIEEDERRVL